ncbi:MAG TPA: biotin/lipoyl-binding protein, partial [Chitinophagales bacterium]|nr:biotin/lipoyl-binding protein [Chitinophagales bacterium]
MWLFEEIENINSKKLSSYSVETDRNKDFRRIKIMFICMLTFLLLLFLPWTQNISSKGIVTSLRPEQRPQELNSMIAGSIEKWYVKEGDLVKKGQAIASLDQRELKKRLEKELNDYMTVRWDFEQTHEDYKDYKDRYLLTDEMKRILE